MKQPTAIQLSIPEPCTQGWNDMQAVQGGRHCAHCQKTVVDFTRMTDAQLFLFFRKEHGNICGRMREDQLSGNIVPIEPQKPRYWPGVCAGVLLLLGLSKSIDGQTIKDHHRIGDTIVIYGVSPNNLVPFKKLPYSRSITTDIRGKVVDHLQRPIAFASVYLYEEKSYRLLAQELTGADGAYRIAATVSLPGRTRLVIKFAYWYDSIVAAGVPLQKELLTVNGVLTTILTLLKDEIVKKEKDAKGFGMMTTGQIVSYSGNFGTRKKYVSEAMHIPVIITTLTLSPWQRFLMYIRRPFR